MATFGTVERLLDAIEYCEQLGLASLFYPSGPNDVAPSAYNAHDVSTGLPSSPLPPSGSAAGFGA